jgi:nitrous oxide reductase accessory protein NosL
MKRILSLGLLVGLFLAACPGNNPAVPPRPTPVVVDTDQCAAAEANLKAQHCIPVDQPYTKKGKSFTQFCQDKQAQGIFLNPACLAKVTSCDQVDACTGSK